MHMANELLSVGVACGTVAIAAGGLALICRRASRVISSEKMALMGVMGAFVFAAQMINFQLPGMPGTSGHMVGAVLLAIILGPHAGAIVISSVVIVQCLIFQDGGLLALGCNIINIGLVPGYLGYFVYKSVTIGRFSNFRTYVAMMLASVIALEVGAVLVVIQAALSGVLLVPFSTFLVTMLGVSFMIGIVEGFATVAVLGYIQQVRPGMVGESLVGRVRLSRKAVLVTLGVFTIITAGGFSLLASNSPDALEWSYLERPDQPDFVPMVSNDNSTIAKADALQAKYSPLPDYSIRDAQPTKATGWTSFAGVIGAGLTMALVWLAGRIVRRREFAKA